MIIVIIIVFFKPNYLGHPDNYIIASISVTPSHLVPEWYFLPFYAVLRSTPDKFGGLILIFFIIFDLFVFDLIINDQYYDFTIKDNIDIIDIDDINEFDIEDDDDIAILAILLFLGGKDIDEPYIDLASLLVLIQFLDYFDLNLDAYDNNT